MTVIIFIIILAVLVLVHEFGHFITAKKSGIRVDEFGIGFPPKLFSWKPKNSETTYSINLIPFGGFVKIFGEDPDSDRGRPGRPVTIGTGPDETNYHTGRPVTIGTGPDEDLSRSFQNKPKYIQVWVLAAGVVFNIIFAWVLLTTGFIVGLPTGVDETNKKYASNVELTVVGVLPDSPAMEAGLKPGDSVLSLRLDESSFDKPTSEEVQNLISNSGGEEIILNIKRGTETKEITFRGKEGIVEDGFAVGIVMDNVGLVKFPLLKAIWEGITTTGKLIVAIAVGLFGFIVDAFSGGADLSQVSGPVGIVGLVGDASRLGFVYLLSFTALISLHLAVLNLIPFPALDGGRILFILIEKIKGSAINPKIQNWVNGVGFILLILLMLVVTFNDVVKLF